MSVNVYDPVNDRLIPVAGATLYGDAPVGSIIAFAGKEINLPEGYLAFNGQTVKRGDYPDLWAFAVANEQVGVDKFFSQGDGSTTFTLADLRETSLKGYGETSRSVGAHVKSGGLAVGEFIDDQLQDHTHNTGDNFWANSSVQSSTETDVLLKNWKAMHTDGSGISTGRSGATTEVKAVGVVWAVKAKMTGLPIDLKEQVERVATRFPDYSHPISIPSGTTTWTATEDCFVNYTYISSVNGTDILLTIDGNVVGTYDQPGGQAIFITAFSGFIKKGQTVSVTGNSLDLSRSGVIKFFPLSS